MSSLKDLDSAVRATIASKRLGRPVFVRLTLRGPCQRRDLLPRLGQLSNLAATWLGQKPRQVYIVANTDQFSASLTWTFEDGSTAVVSFAQALSALDADLDVLVIGNHGALYHDAGAANLWDDMLRYEAAEPDPLVLKAIEEGLKSGRPEWVQRP